MVRSRRRGGSCPPRLMPDVRRRNRNEHGCWPGLMRGNKSAFLTRPGFLAGLPPAVLSQLEAGEALLFALDTRSHPPSFAIGVFIAFGQLQSMFAAARTEQRRIQRAMRRISGLKRPGQNTRTLFHDVHFYLICWGRVAKLAKYVTHTSGFSRAELVVKRHRLLLNKMTAFRDHLEHFEERLPGGPPRRALRERGDLFNMVGDHVSIGGERVDVGANGLQRLAVFVEEFETAVLYDALEELAQREPTGVPHQVQRAVLQVGIDRRVSQVQRRLLNSPAARPRLSHE